MSKPKNIFQDNYFYFDKYNNEKLIQKRKPVPPNITCMMNIRNNVRYMSVIRIVGFKFYSADCRKNQRFLQRTMKREHFFAQTFLCFAT